MNLPTVVMFGAGVILIYAAIKDRNPKDVVSSALQPQPAAPSKPVHASGL